MTALLIYGLVIALVIFGIAKCVGRLLKAAREAHEKGTKTINEYGKKEERK